MPEADVVVFDTGPLSHYALLRTTQELLGLPCLNGACSVASFRAAFNL